MQNVNFILLVSFTLLKTKLFTKIQWSKKMFNRSVNKVVLIGNLGKAPEIRHTQAGITVANLTLATTESWKDKGSSERKESTEWHKLTVFNRLGEMCGQYLKKGNKVYIEGQLKTRKWKAQDGSDRYTTEITVSDIELLDSKDVSAKGTTQSETILAHNHVSNDSTIKQITPANANYAAVDFDDDIPF